MPESVENSEFFQNIMWTFMGEESAAHGKRSRLPWVKKQTFMGAEKYARCGGLWEKNTTFTGQEQDKYRSYKCLL